MICMIIDNEGKTMGCSLVTLIKYAALLCMNLSSESSKHVMLPTLNERKI